MNLTRTSYYVDPGLARAMEDPLAFTSLVAADAFIHLPVFLGSMYSSLGGFGGTAASLPPTGVATIVGLWIAAALGLCGAWRSTSLRSRAASAYIAALVLACVVQAPTRQVLLGISEQHQGRWLFPVAVPVALALATGLSRVGGVRSWPLVALASLTLMGSAALAVIQFHVASPTWVLDQPHLYVHSTGGSDIGIERTTAQVTLAWAATSPPLPAILLLVSCLVCGALLLLCRPESGPTHVHHADHR